MKRLLLIILLIPNAFAFAQSAEESFAKGVLKAASGDNAGALKEFDKAITLKADFFDALYRRGIVKIALTDYIGADADFSVALKLKPNYPDALMNRALAKSKLLNYPRAEADLNVLLEARQTYAKAYSLRGQTKLNLKDNDGACEDFRQALEYGDKSVMQYSGLCSGEHDISKITPKKVICSLAWPDTLEWKRTDSVNDGTLCTVKYMKSGESLTQWTEQSAITINQISESNTLEGMMNGVLKKEQASFPQAKSTILYLSEEEEFPYQEFVIEYPEYSAFYHLIQANNSNVVIKVSLKKKGLDKEYWDTWKDIISREVRVLYR